MNYFCYGGKCSRDYGIYISGSGTYNVPERDITKVEVPGKMCIRDSNKALLEFKEAELLELMTEAEKFIEGIEKSEVRIMFRLYYIDGLPWWKVAMKMNNLFPRRRIEFTEDSCRMRNTRFLEEK